MHGSQAYENYPAWMVLGSNLLSISMYLIGAAILYQIGIIWVVLYGSFSCLNSGS